MIGIRVMLALLLSASLSGCAQGSFERFMDHPILSWLPVDEYLGDQNANLKVPPMRPGQDKMCYETAEERTGFAIQSDTTETEVQNLFRAEYAECLRIRSN